MKLIFTFLLTICVATGVFAQGSKKVKTINSLKVADSLFMLQRWKEAIPVYEVVLKSGSGAQTPLAFNRLGFSYQNLSEYDKALVNYRKALTMEPPAPLRQTIYSRMARVFSVKKDVASAFMNLDSALRLGYTNVGELQNHAEFASIRTDKRFDEKVKFATLNASPCMTTPQAREFDFWIGEWDAYVTGTNNLAGHSRIDLAAGGCMILENWTSAGSVPFSGKSINFVDPANNKWKQIWVGSNGLNVSEFLNGEYRDAAMRFEFETTDAQGAKQLVHFHFFNQGPDQVRQFHEVSSDNGSTWTATYDFTYKRKK